MADAIKRSVIAILLIVAAVLLGYIVKQSSLLIG